MKDARLSQREYALILALLLVLMLIAWLTAGDAILRALTDVWRAEMMSR